jgi:hypothetical protein
MDERREKMNHKIMLICLLLIANSVLAQSQDINLNKINFPKAYIHAGKEFPEGSYEVVLTVKENVPFFNIYNSKQELLFEEMAVVKAHSGRKMASAYRLKKEFLKEDEYFRIMVIKPEQWLMGYFLVKK